jgi:hypothetical protein
VRLARWRRLCTTAPGGTQAAPKIPVPALAASTPVMGFISLLLLFGRQSGAAGHMIVAVLVAAVAACTFKAVTWLRGDTPGDVACCRRGGEAQQGRRRTALGGFLCPHIRTGDRPGAPTQFCSMGVGPAKPMVGIGSATNSNLAGSGCPGGPAGHGSGAQPESAAGRTASAARRHQRHRSRSGSISLNNTFTYCAQCVNTVA